MKSISKKAAHEWLIAIDYVRDTYGDDAVDVLPQCTDSLAYLPYLGWLDAALQARIAWRPGYGAQRRSHIRMAGALTASPVPIPGKHSRLYPKPLYGTQLLRRLVDFIGGKDAPLLAEKHISPAAVANVLPASWGDRWPPQGNYQWVAGSVGAHADSATCVWVPDDKNGRWGKPRATEMVMPNQKGARNGVHLYHLTPRWGGATFPPYMLYPDRKSCQRCIESLLAGVDG